MPISEAPYKRTYEHTKARGREKVINCGLCGRLVPRYKTFISTKFFSPNDPFILSAAIDKRFVKNTIVKTVRLCPSCARFQGIKQPGKSVRKKHLKD